MDYRGTPRALSKNIQKLKVAYPARLREIFERADIPKRTRLVYILFCDDQPLVVGEGEVNRARVITDSLKSITPSHKKALKVRLYHLYAPPPKQFTRFIITCDTKEEARQIEKGLHQLIGGNKSAISPIIESKLFAGLEAGSLASTFLRLAICSSFDGLSDLKKWRREGIITDDTWEQLSAKLKLN